MGRKVSDGKAINLVAPTSQIINDYDLYRITNINGVAVTSKDATQADRTLAFEIDTNSIYSIKVPAGFAPAVGHAIFWANPDIFQRGDTNLTYEPAVSGDQPCFFVTKAVNAAGYIQGRVLNGTSGTAFQGS